MAIHMERNRQTWDMLGTGTKRIWWWVWWQSKRKWGTWGWELRFCLEHLSGCWFPLRKACGKVICGCSLSYLYWPHASSTTLWVVSCQDNLDVDCLIRIKLKDANMWRRLRRVTDIKHCEVHSSEMNLRCYPAGPWHQHSFFSVYQPFLYLLPSLPSLNSMANYFSHCHKYILCNLAPLLLQWTLLIKPHLYLFSGWRRPHGHSEWSNIKIMFAYSCVP